MRIVVTGSSGHLGEALVRKLGEDGYDVVGIDMKHSPFTGHIGSIADSDFVKKCLQGVDIVLHTATLHKPHVATHSRQEFVDTNISGTLNLLEESVRNQVRAFVYTSTTSTFGDAMRTEKGDPAVWVTEDLEPEPKNIYGVTKIAAEDLCQLFSRNQELPCVILRTSRFFPEADDDKGQRESFTGDNLKVNELLFRRVDVEDIVTAHKLAMLQAREISFNRFIISATTPFKRSDAARLGTNAPEVLYDYFPQFKAEYARRNWKMFSTIGRVYDNTRAREVLGWTPQYDFKQVLKRLESDEDFRSPLAQLIGAKGYHDKLFSDGPYPID